MLPLLLILSAFYFDSAWLFALAIGDAFGLFDG